MNKAYADIIRARIAGALDEARALRAISHDGVVGSLRETVIRQLLTPLLPSYIGASTGIVTSSDGEQSRQCDIVLYERRLIPPMLVSEAGLFPIEAVLGCIEVKSCLDADEVSKAHECAVSVHRLQASSGYHDDNDRPLPHLVRRPMVTLFAFATDLVSTYDIDRYVEFCASVNAAEELEMICVVGDGCWIDTPNGWITWAGDEAHEEVLGFLACLSNTLPTIAATRGEPRLGTYLAPWGNRVYWKKRKKRRTKPTRKRPYA